MLPASQWRAVEGNASLFANARYRGFHAVTLSILSHSSTKRSELLSKSSPIKIIQAEREATTRGFRTRRQNFINTSNFSSSRENCSSRSDFRLPIRINDDRTLQRTGACTVYGHVLASESYFVFCSEDCICNAFFNLISSETLLVDARSSAI